MILNQDTATSLACILKVSEVFIISERQLFVDFMSETAAIEGIIAAIEGTIAAIEGMIAAIEEIIATIEGVIAAN
jgi:hypothetical protein